jgi:hypothetical protein
MRGNGLSQSVVRPQLLDGRQAPRTLRKVSLDLLRLRVRSLTEQELF